MGLRFAGLGACTGLRMPLGLGLERDRLTVHAMKEDQLEEVKRMEAEEVRTHHSYPVHDRPRYSIPGWP